MTTPLVSIITPTFNRVDMLGAAINTVKNQTLKDWEMVVIDDCSTDNTAQVVGSHQVTDNRITYYGFSKNSGSPVVPRNKGVALAKGKYVAFLDSDDLWHPEKLATQVGYLETIGECFSYHDILVKYVDREGRDSGVWSKMSTCHSGPVFTHLLRKNFVPTSSVLITKEAYLRYGGMDMSLDISHDWDLWLRVAFENDIHFIPDILAGTLLIHWSSVISEVHKRRRESRRVIRKWLPYVDGMYYRKVMLYYYLMEVVDILPTFVQERLRAWWYEQSHYK